jgi:outer membrane biosynthesis protein TonB
MPTIEVPTSPPGKRPDSLFRRKRVRYEELGQDELLHLIDKLQDERSRARLREGIWISVLAHLLLFWFVAYGPRVLWHQPHVVNPSDRKDMTYLDLPPDALRQLKPKPEAPLSDKNRIAQSAHPVLDRKTLEQLQAMRRAGPPLPVPPQAQPAPQPQQAQAQPQPPQPPAQPLQSTQQAQIDAPQPAPTRPNFNNSSTPGEAIRQAEQGAGRGSLSGDSGINGPSQHQPMKAGVDILSDTMGVDFGPYMDRVIADTYRSWLPIIPESARPPLDKQGRVGIRFKIYPDGTVKQMILEFPSGDVSLDRAAWGGITGAGYPPLPKEFKGPFLELRFGFYYNLDPNKPQ